MINTICIRVYNIQANNIQCLTEDISCFYTYSEEVKINKFANTIYQDYVKEDYVKENASAYVCYLNNDIMFLFNMKFMLDEYQVLTKILQKDMCKWLAKDIKSKIDNLLKITDNYQI